MFYIISLLLILAAGWLWRRERVHAIHQEDASWLPLELQRATLQYTEHQFFTKFPFQLVARVDRAYLAEDNKIILVDFKRRKIKRAFLSDVVEISAQRLAMQGAGIKNVEMHAYVVVIDPETNRKTPVLVDLEDKSSLIRRQYRLNTLRNGVVEPTRTSHKRLCATCGHHSYCPGTEARK